MSNAPSTPKHPQQDTQKRQGKHTPTALRVLQTLQYLLANPNGATTTQLLEHLSETGTNHTIGSDTLIKYINTLRYAGCAIPSASGGGIYRLTASPIGYQLTSKEADALREALTATFLHTQCETDWLHALYKVLWHMDLTSNTAKQLDETNPLRELRDMLAMGEALPHNTDNGYNSPWQDFCDDEMALAITYNPPQFPKPVQLCVDPVSVKPSGPFGEIFTGICRHTRQQQTIHVAWVTDVRPLPMKRQYREQLTRVVFALTGKLARTYRLYPHEEILSHTSRPDTPLTVMAKVNDMDSLLQRLMKYGSLCEIISPSHIRDQMARRIQTLVGFNAQLAPNEHNISS